ncbi:ImmA/IrrE family metallo-endopeptidase [Leptolyngbya sp. 7M]|uniref:ImmA/IrrE family metallo-endopeptidase n=1 Tax=Leptolyngbya sp. 7M TaxID=2812896 RepID=UPI001B8CC83F|nr:ImmA/IrrE family metallo-endopeptidase [Leptolyngbya sp. 7M]QYO65524.1 ImmA/IrrE family metallo-endopeptidase [Leptolyngbya sp. 7M]
MRFFLEKIEALGVGWNRRPLSEADFYVLCRRHKITVQEMSLRVSGFYYSMLGRHFIAIDSRLPPAKKLFVMFHEFAHFLMHAPDNGVTANFHGIGRKTRKETEADLFAAIALIPRCWLETRTAYEIVTEEGIDPELVDERFRIFKYRGI